MSLVADLALRAAVNGSDRNIAEVGGITDTIKSVAENRADELVKGSPGAASTNFSATATSAAAIAAALEALTLAYAAVSRQVLLLKTRRASYEEEYKAGIATFKVHKKELRDLSVEEKAIKRFITLSTENNDIYTYLGIHNAKLTTDEHVDFYSVLPFYKLAEALGQPSSGMKPLDRERREIDLFLKSELPDILAGIDDGFATANSFWQLCKSIGQRKNYLNDLRAPRFIVMSVANLLWNLQRPVDPKTGFTLGIPQCIALCTDVGLYLNKLLNAEFSPYLPNISSQKNKLISFLLQAEIHTKALRASYLEQQLQETNMDGVTSCAHQALRIMDQRVLQLLYKRRNPETGKKEPDDRAAGALAHTVSYLNRLLIQNPTLITHFVAFTDNIPRASGINNPPATVIDVLIICCHLSRMERYSLIKMLKATGIGSASEFADTLIKFDNKFVRPIKRIARDEVGSPWWAWRKKQEEVRSWTARRLLPIITLVVGDYHVAVDTPQNQENTTGVKEAQIRSGTRQIQLITRSAENGRGYYRWALSPFAHIPATTDTAKELDALPSQQYRMTQMSKLLDSVGELVNDYRNFLQNSAFQPFLLKCLRRVKAEYAALEKRIKLVDDVLIQSEGMNRGLKGILADMIKDLSKSLDDFASAASDFEKVVSAPDFTEHQKKIVKEKIGAIQTQFFALFGEDSGIGELLHEKITPPPQEHLEKAVATDKVEARTVVALSKLAHRCYKALSAASKSGYKGLLLHTFISKIEKKCDFTKEEISRYILDLAHITASYRRTWFFQADYAHTRSAKVLIAAIQDPVLNECLPLAEVIFHKHDVDCLQLTKEKIQIQLGDVRRRNQLEEPVSTIQISACA